MRGFKSLRDAVELDIRPLTILAGRNSSGKSSFLQPFLLLKQTAEAPLDQGPLRLHGENVRLARAAEMFWQAKGGTARPGTLEVWVRGGYGEPRLTFGRGQKGVALLQVEAAGAHARVRIGPGSREGDLRKTAAIHWVKEGEGVWRPRRRQFHFDIESRTPDGMLYVEVLRRRCQGRGGGGEAREPRES